MAKRRCLNEGSCPGDLDECSLQFPVEVRGGLEPGDKIFVCNVCMKVFFITKSPLCGVCGKKQKNPDHISKNAQISVDREQEWPKHKFRP